MSFDLFVGCFENGELADFPTAQVLEAFAAHTLAVEPDGLQLAYDDSGIACTYVHLDTAAPSVNGFSVNRPVDDPALYQAIVGRPPEAVVPGGSPALGLQETGR